MNDDTIDHAPHCPYAYAWDVAAECSAQCECLRAWLVISPEYGEVDPILDGGTGPMEYGRDVAYVEAMTKRDALVLGVKLMRARGDRWFRYHDENPYVGVSVEDLTCPTHGMPTWEKDHYVCVRCEEHENQVQNQDSAQSPCAIR